MANRRGIPGVSFSWKRALGLSAAKRQLSGRIGIPLTRAGRQQKVGGTGGEPGQPDDALYQPHPKGSEPSTTI